MYSDVFRSMIVNGLLCIRATYPRNSAQTLNCLLWCGPDRHSHPEISLLAALTYVRMHCAGSIVTIVRKHCCLHFISQSARRKKLCSIRLGLCNLLHPPLPTSMTNSTKERKKAKAAAASAGEEGNEQELRKMAGSAALKQQDELKQAWQGGFSLAVLAPLIASVWQALSFYETPFAGDAVHVAPLKGLVAPVQVMMGLNAITASCGLGLAGMLLRSTGLIKVGLGLSLFPMVLFGTALLAGGIILEQWQLLWLPFSASFVLLAQYVVELMFVSMQQEVVEWVTKRSTPEEKAVMAGKK